MILIKLFFNFTHKIKIIFILNNTKEKERNTCFYNSYNSFLSFERFFVSQHNNNQIGFTIIISQ